MLGEGFDSKLLVGGCGVSEEWLILLLPQIVPSPSNK